MCRRWRLILGALSGLAAAITLTALAVTQVAADESGQNENHRWQTEAAEGEITVTWNSQPTGPPDPIRPAHSHGNDEWKYKRTDRTTEIAWTGSPGPSPCDGNSNRSHCAYVVVHQNPWEIDKDGHPEDAEVKLSLCADVSGSAPPSGDLLISGNQATCTDGDDPYASSNRHGDADFIAQWDDRINAGLTGADRIEANAHTLPDTPRRNDEVVSRGHHHSAAHDYETHGHAFGYGGTGHAKAHGVTGRFRHEHPTDHKTVMFWVWWEHAADEEPEPVHDLQPFSPVVSVVVDGGFDVADGHGGTAFAVSFSSTMDGCGAVDGHAASGRYTLSNQSSSWATTQDTGVRLVGVPVGSSQQCRYTAGFPDRPETAGSRLELLRVIDRSVSVRFPDASATYHVPVTPSTFFDAQVKIVVPSAQNGATISGVTIRPLPSLSPSLRSSCSPDATHSYAGSSLGAVHRYPELVDTPSGADERCSYQVRFPHAVDVDGGTLKRTSTSATRTIDAAYPEALVGYAFEAAPESGTFQPVIQITGGGNSQFVVGQTPDTSISVWCTAADSKTFLRGRNRLADPNDTLWALIDRPQGTTDACEYDIDFPAEVTSPNGTLYERTTDEVVRVTAASPTARATYAEKTWVCPEGSTRAGSTIPSTWRGETLNRNSQQDRDHYCRVVCPVGSERAGREIPQGEDHGWCNDRCAATPSVSDLRGDRTGDRWTLTWDGTTSCYDYAASTEQMPMPFTSDEAWWFDTANFLAPSQIYVGTWNVKSLSVSADHFDWPDAQRCLQSFRGLLGYIPLGCGSVDLPDPPGGVIHGYDRYATPRVHRIDVTVRGQQLITTTQLRCIRREGGRCVQTEPVIQTNRSTPAAWTSPWMCPKQTNPGFGNPHVATSRSLRNIPANVTTEYDRLNAVNTSTFTAEQRAAHRQQLHQQRRNIYQHCYSFTPVVTIEVPDDEYRITNLRNAQPIPVTFTKQNPQPAANTDCDVDADATVTRTYVPGENEGDAAVPVERRGGSVRVTDADGNPLAPPTLHGACVYDVSYPSSAAGGELRLVEPVDDPATAEREDQVAADDPATTWDERATEATYEGCAAPNGFWSDEVGVSLAFADAPSPVLWWDSQRYLHDVIAGLWVDRSERSDAFARLPVSATFDWAAIDAGFDWGSDPANCERAMERTWITHELPPDNRRVSIAGAPDVDDYLPVDVAASVVALPPESSDPDALVTLELQVAACASTDDGDTNRQNNDWRCGQHQSGWTPWLCPASAERAGLVVPTHSDDGLSTWYQADNPRLRLPLSTNPDGKPVLANRYDFRHDRSHFTRRPGSSLRCARDTAFCLNALGT